jgi:hypothetical protein
MNASTPNKINLYFAPSCPFKKKAVHKETGQTHYYTMRSGKTLQEIVAFVGCQYCKLVLSIDKTEFDEHYTSGNA